MELICLSHFKPQTVGRITYVKCIGKPRVSLWGGGKGEKTGSQQSLLL